MESSIDMIAVSRDIRSEAFRLGFVDCGFSRVRFAQECEIPLQNWLDNGYQAGMDYMNRNVDKRLHPGELVEGAKTVISLLYNYYSRDFLSASSVKIAKYAYGIDYHEVVKENLWKLDSFIKSKVKEVSVSQRCFVDSAPVMERFWAQNSGLGWIGKNSCLISRKHGSFVFIGEIVTTLELDYGEPLNDYCGNCRKCIDACPTQAITQNRTINSHRCISYQTIENKGEINEEFLGKLNGNIFGCDICQDVCPWNRKAIAHSEPLFNLRNEVRELTTEQWEKLNEEEYRFLFRKSAIKRAKFIGLKRNINFINRK